MVLIFGFHRSKNSSDVSPFNELFLKKISKDRDVTVISIRNISFRRSIFSFEDFGRYKLIEISAFVLPGRYANFILRTINFLIARLVYRYLFNLKKLSDVTLVHQIGLFTPIGYYFSNFLKVKFLLQLIGNDKYNFQKWRIKLSESDIITANAAKLLDNVPARFDAKVIYRGVDPCLYGCYRFDSSFRYGKIFYGGGFPDYTEKSEVRKFNYKGGLSLIDVVSKINGYQTSIAGPNCEIGESYATRIGAANITFLGYLSHSELLKQILDTDIVIIPSFDEGIANIAMESMLGQKLVISRDVGGMGELITNNETGLLFNTDEDLEHILTDIQKAYRENAISHLNKIRQNGKICVIDQFNNEKMIAEYANIYDRFSRDEGLRQTN